MKGGREGTRGREEGRYGGREGGSQVGRLGGRGGDRNRDGCERVLVGGKAGRREERGQRPGEMCSRTKPLAPLLILIRVTCKDLRLLLTGSLHLPPHVMQELVAPTVGLPACLSVSLCLLTKTAAVENRY